MLWARLGRSCPNVQCLCQFRETVDHDVMNGIRRGVGRCVIAPFARSAYLGCFEAHALGCIQVKVVARDHANLLRLKLQELGDFLVWFGQYFVFPNRFAGKHSIP